MGFFSGFFGHVLEGVGILGASAVLGPEVAASFGISSAAGGAIVGGIAGAGIAAATGQNILTGTISGAAGGYMAPGAMSTLTGTSAAADAATATTTKAAQAAAAGDLSAGSSVGSGYVAGGALASDSLNTAEEGATSLTSSLTKTAATDMGTSMAGSTAASTGASLASKASGFFSNMTTAEKISAGASAVNALTGAYTAKKASQTLSTVGAPPKSPANNVSSQLQADASIDYLRRRRGLASNILTAPTGYTMSKSASQMLLG